MSNIIKYWGAKGEPEERVINSNPKADAFLSELLRLREQKEEEKRLAALKESGDSAFTELDLTKMPRPVDSFQKEREAREKAEDIIKEANETAESILNQAIANAKRQEEEIKEVAREQGYQEGYQGALEEISQKEKELEAKKEQLRQTYEKEVQALLPKFTDLIIKYVERLTGILADEYESVIYNVLALAITNSEPSKAYSIHVPKEQYKYVMSKEDYIREVIGNHASFEIVPDATLSVNSCKIETENYVIDSGLDTRLMTLINSLKILGDSYK